MPTGAGCCGCSLRGQEPDDTLSISYERIALLVFKEHNSLSTQKSKQEFPLICPWLYAYIIPLISFAWDQKQIHSLLVEMILQSCDPSQKGEQESTSHAQTSTPEAVCGVAFSAHPRLLRTFAGLVCSGVEAEESDWAALPPLQVEAAWQAVFISRYTKGN